MDKTEKQALATLIISFLLVASCILSILIALPSMPIFGFSHSIVDPTDPDLNSITITSLPLFQVLTDDFYSIQLKTAYVSLFVFEILSFCSSLFLLIYIFLTDKKRVGMVIYTCSILCLILDIHIIALFNGAPTIFACAITCLLISLSCTTIYTLFCNEKILKRK